MIRVQSTPVLLTFGIIVGLLVVAPRSVDGQAQARVVRISDALVCPSCLTILQPIATLGGHEGPGEIHRPPIAICEDRLGRFWLLPGANEMPRVYSGKGLKPRYRFTRWSADGKMIADFERDAGWFPRKDKVNPLGNTETPPAPNFVRVIPGDEARLWTIVNVPSPNWQRAWERVAKGAPEY